MGVNGITYYICNSDSRSHVDDNMECHNAKVVANAPGRDITPYQKALQDWDKNHLVGTTHEQDFDLHANEQVRRIVEENIDIRIPFESTPP